MMANLQELARYDLRREERKRILHKQPDPWPDGLRLRRSNKTTFTRRLLDFFPRVMARHGLAILRSDCEVQVAT